MSVLQGQSFDSISVGQTAEFSQTLTAELVAQFAAVSGDLNPVHLDPEYAKSTAFGEPIGHGAWISSVVSAAIAMRLPGPGSIYRSQQISFKEPVRPGDTITVRLEVSEKKDRLKLLQLGCQVVNQHGKTVAKGVAEVIAPAQSQQVETPAAPVFQRVE